ncbi:MAG: GntR family transcriptional regulator [Nocardioides sp.]
MTTHGRTPRRGRRLRSSSVREELVRRIEDGSLPTGSRLPSEPDLAAELSVSRATVREALQALATDGMVERRRGSGTFVTDRPRMVNSLDLNFGVTEAIVAAGMRPGTRGATFRVEPATVENATHLGVSPGTNLLVIDRVRTADDAPVVLSRDLLVKDLAGDRDAVVGRMLEGSIYDVLREDLHIAVDHGVATLRPILADSYLASRLSVEPGALLVYLWQVDYASNGRPVLLSHEYHLAEAFDFSVIRRGPKGS